MVEITKQYLFSLLERELNDFENWVTKYKISVALNDEFRMRNETYEMEKVQGRKKIIEEILKELDRKEIKE